MQQAEPGQSAQVADLFDDAVAGMPAVLGGQHRQIAVRTAGAAREALCQDMPHP
ncbi:MAG: hypothetical protein ABW224_00290 [Kibdelosporangium sp.]